MAPRPTEVKLVAKLMDPEISEDSMDLAREIIEALDQARQDRDAWVVVARTMKDGPVLTVGPFSTVLQASKAMHKIPFADLGEGVGARLAPLRTTKWIDEL